MKYNLWVRTHNLQAHRDIDADMMAKKNGLFTFTIKVNNGNIVDYMCMETESYAAKKTG